MESKLLQDENGLKTFALVFDKAEKVKEPLLRFATKNKLRGAQITAIGAFMRSRLASLTDKRKAIERFP